MKEAMIFLFFVKKKTIAYTINNDLDAIKYNDIDYIYKTVNVRQLLF